jgi:hypothetical protein
MIPWVVVQAFTTELYLKCLVLLSVGKAAWGHELVDLYNKLDPKAKQRVETLYNQALQAKIKTINPNIVELLPLSLANKLKECTNAFDAFRYGFEQVGTWTSPTGTPPMPVPGELLDAVRNAILELKPDWRNP